MKKFFATLILALGLGFGTQLIAQPPDPGGGGGGPSCFPPPCIPIDGGLSLLLVAGVAYGGKKVYDMNKGKEQ